MSVSDWASVITAMASVVGAAATIVIAWVAHRFTVNKYHRDQLEAGRSSNAAWSRDLDHRLHDPTGASPVQTVLGVEPPVVSKLKAAGADVREIDALRGVLSGHLSWLSPESPSFNAWIGRLDNADGESMSETVAGIVNGVLDVVKDYVLVDGRGEVSESEWLHHGFWTELDSPDLLESSTQVIHSSVATLSARQAAAGERWIKPGVPTDSKIRLQALVRYKLQLERALALSFVGEFVNWNLDGRTANSDKFRMAMRSMVNDVRDDFEREVGVRLDMTYAR